MTKLNKIAKQNCTSIAHEHMKKKSFQYLHTSNNAFNTLIISKLAITFRDKLTQLPVNLWIHSNKEFLHIGRTCIPRIHTTPIKRKIIVIDSMPTLINLRHSKAPNLNINAHFTHLSRPGCPPLSLSKYRVNKQTNSPDQLCLGLYLHSFCVRVR